MPKVKVGKLNLYYEITGEGETVLFIAGLGLTHNAWDKQVNALSKRFRCITFDNRDAGQSDASPERYGVRDMAEDTAGLMHALKVDSAHVIGFSMGGAIAQELAISSPQLVKRLCLIATFTSGDQRGTANLTLWAMLKQTLSPEDYIRATLPWVYSYQDYKIPGLIEAAVKDYVNAESRQPIEQYKRQVWATTNHNSEDRLNRISAPTLLIFGTDDILTPMRFANKLREGIKGSKLALINGTGHGLLWASAHEVNQAIMKFLSE